MIRENDYNNSVASLKIRNKGFFNENREEFLFKFKNSFINSIKGLFIYANREEDLIIFYGNNKEIIGYEDKFIVFNFNEAKEFIHDNYIDTLLYELNNFTKDIEIKVINILGQEVWVRINGVTKKDVNGNLLEFEGYIHNISNEKDSKLKLEYINAYDELTELNNRKSFKSIMENQLKEHALLESRGALVIVDIDNFKYVNDSYGHNCGDMFLKNFADDLKNALSSNELLCRFGGDEFLIFIPYISDFHDVKKVVTKITDILKIPYNINNNKIFTSASIGVAVFPDDGEEFELLLKNADAAMYLAKSNGKNKWEMFNSNISREINRIYSIQRGLRTALDNGEMFVVFQPKVRLLDNEIDGFEALLRWNSSEIGLVSPSEFIPIAESTRLIIPIGKFVLREVFIKIKYLLCKGYDNFKIAVNLSEIQLREGDLLEYFKQLIEEFRFSPKYIEFEITESMIMKSVDRNINYLMQIKRLGASIALDDFGTGYSSLNHLTKLPIDVLKIDRSFVNDMIENDKSRYIVEKIIQLSHKLGITVVAEGVEEKEQVDYLKEMECDTVQGYYYSKPQNFENVMKMLNK